MIMGMMAAQMRAVLGGTARPVYVAVQSTVSGSASFSAVLPVGWVAGQLAIMHIASGTTAPSAPAGWTVVGSTLTADAGTSALFWRILQGGDSDPVIDAGANRAAIIWTFGAATFNQSTPVVEISARTYGDATFPSTITALASSPVTAGEHYVMQFASTYNNFNTITTYPYASAQNNRGIGSTPTYSASRGCGQNFDGGVSASSSFVNSAGSYATTRKIAIIGLGFVP
jgi:hypothetical protein